jgi:type I restriction enzyme S subunit
MTDTTKSARKSWTKVAFGDVVQLARERSSDPEADGYERFIGLEHIDPGDLRVRRWGNIADGVTFTNVFKPGQVLFGKRRAYQRKVAVADFGGVCSSDIYVLEPKGEGLLPELLPFICQTDAFFEHAVGTSAGSLSPRTNWDSLASFEFALPPIEEQRSSAALLTTSRRLCESYAYLAEAASQLLQSVLEHEFSVRGDTAPLSQWCHNLITYGIVQAGPDTPGGVPYIRVSDMTQGSVLTKCGMLRTTPMIAAKYVRSRVSTGDLVVALRGQVGLTRVVPPELDGANLTQGTARVSVAREHCAEYVYWALQSPDTRRQYRSLEKGSTFSEISLEALRRIQIPVRSREAQLAVAARMASLSGNVSAIRERYARATAVHTTILRVALGDRE